MPGSARVRGGAALLGCCAVLAGAGCASARPTATAHETTSNAAATSTVAIGQDRRTPAAQYLAIARAGNRGLDATLGRLEERDRNNFAAAKRDLRGAAAVERRFDRRLLQIPFAAPMEAVAHRLYRVNQARARLTARAAASTSLRQLHAYEPRLDAANKPVEQAVRTIRRQLGLPPPPSS